MTTDAPIPALTVRTAGLAAVFDPGDSKAWACGGFRTAWPLGMGIVSPEPVMESFFHTLKTERVHHRVYATRDQARRDLFQYIEGFYNPHRLHSALGYLSPAEMERRAA